jgi:hypothetical protein
MCRKEAVNLIVKQLDNNTPASGLKGWRHHYGAQELRELLDAIYGPPRDVTEEIPHQKYRK